MVIAFTQEEACFVLQFVHYGEAAVPLVVSANLF